MYIHICMYVYYSVQCLIISEGVRQFPVQGSCSFDALKGGDPQSINELSRADCDCEGGIYVGSSYSGVCMGVRGRGYWILDAGQVMICVHWNHDLLKLCAAKRRIVQCIHIRIYMYILYVSVCECFA